jgi:hypothetical protein
MTIGLKNSLITHWLASLLVTELIKGIPNHHTVKLLALSGSNTAAMTPRAPDLGGRRAHPMPRGGKTTQH